MSKDSKAIALVTWRRMLEEPNLYIDPEELYDMLLKMADSLEQAGIISSAEWRHLVRDASIILVGEGSENDVGP